MASKRFRFVTMSDPLAITCHNTRVLS